MLPESLAKNSGRGAKLTSLNLSAAGFGAGFSRQVYGAVAKPSVSSGLAALLDVAERRNAGVLLSIDEVHRQAMPDLREITQAVQLAFKANRQLAFVAAGLPTAVNAVLNDKVLTFLRRSTKYQLDWLNRDETIQAIAGPFQKVGKQIDEDIWPIALYATGGHPFFVQMFGFQLWNAAGDNTRITLQNAESAAESTWLAICNAHETALADLSVKDREFLYAMAEDNGPSNIGDIAHRLASSNSNTGQYRRRLLAAEMIETAERGKVDFAIPRLRDYLQSPEGQRRR
jgi:hypothetical protein